MTNIKRIISVVLAAVMLLMLLPVLSKDTEKASQTAAEEEAEKLDMSYSLVLNAIEAEDYETAKAYLSRCFSLCDPQTNSSMYADLLLKQACIDVIENKSDMAMQALDAALSVQPELADAYLVRAQVCLDQGNTDEAIESLEKYIELTGDASLYETVAQLHEAGGDFAAAQTAYEKYIAGTGGDREEAGFQSGIYKMHAGQPEDAVAVFEDYLDSETYCAAAAYYIGVCKMSLEDYVGAGKAFDSCIEKGGTFEGLYYNRGVCSLVNDDWEAAAADFTKSIESEPYVNDARYNLGVCQMQMEDYESAAASFTELIGDGEQSEGAEEAAGDGERQTARDEAYYCRALCHASLGKLEAAIADYTTCIDHGYELAQCYTERAQVYAAMGDTENYNSDLQNALKYEE